MVSVGETTSSRGKSIALARFHDGKAKANWGGRGTSLALAGLVAELGSVGRIIPINGEYITHGFADFLLTDKLLARARFAKDCVLGHRRSLETRPFTRVEEYADRLLQAKAANPRVRDLIGLISDSDELWMNGEGDFIMGYSGTLWRTLIIMSIAQKLGKPTVLLNSILSAPSTEPPIPGVVEGVGKILKKCRAVIYRDPQSLELSRTWFPDVSASWLPDALFTWSDYEMAPQFPSYRPEVEGLPLEVQEMVNNEAKIVSVSGSSVMRSYTADRGKNLSKFVRSLKSRGFSPVLVSTSDEDAWLELVATGTNIPYVPPTVPLISGLHLLRASEVFVSGRYHPSILAACVGTPLVTFGSNSHKTLSLQTVLGVSDPMSYATFDSEHSVLDIAAATERAASGDGGSRQELRKVAMSCSKQVQSGMQAAL